MYPPISYLSLRNECFKCQLQIGACQEHLPGTEQQQGHLPSASAKIEPCAAAGADLQHPLRGAQVENGALCAPGKLVQQVFRWLDIFRN